MGLYKEQLEKRAEHDKKMIGESMVSAIGAVLGERAAVRIRDDRMITKQAFDDLLKYYHFQPVEIPNNITDYSSQLDYCLNIYGIMKRQIFLSENWWNESYGPVLVYTKEKHIPVFTVKDNIVEVSVGSAAHPMLPEHYIEWIAIETAKGVQRKALKPEEKPCAEFLLTDGDSVVGVYAYCNLHGLWKAE